MTLVPKSEAGLVMVLDKTFNFRIKYLSLLLLLLLEMQVKERKKKKKGKDKKEKKEGKIVSSLSLCKCCRDYYLEG